jgi:hypothetical protein
MFVVTADESETLCCHICKRAFSTLERAWLASPSGGGQGIWVHQGCLSGKAQALLGTSEYRLRRGWLTPEPVRMKPVPDDASDLLRHYCEGFRFLVACKSCHPQTVPNAATVFAPAFAALWCGLRKGSIWSAHQEALARDLIVFAGIYKKQALYLPGKDE